nr:hypothetical protein [Tanacetum cinerariifolium]
MKRARINKCSKGKGDQDHWKSTEGSKSHQKTVSEFAPAEEPMQTTQDLEEPTHPEIETGAADDNLSQKLLSILNGFRNKRNLQLLILMKGSCKSLVELEFFLEEVYKATTYQLDWNNPEGQQYPHNLLKPLPSICNSRGHHVIPFNQFINKDVEYLCGGTFGRKYTTFVTKTKAADYGHIKWIEDLFYGFAVNIESARDVYLKRRIIAVTELQIIEWHNYKHLDWITVRRDDDKKADKSHGRRTLCFQRLSKNVPKKHRHLTTCGRSSTRCRKLPKEAQPYKAGYVPFRSQAQGSLHRLLQSNRIHLSEERQAEQAIWRRSDKERAATMIQAIDKQLKTRKIMQSLEKFVGGILYEGDFRMLQRTI